MEFTIENIKAARDKSAIIVAQYGKHYLPIFERLEKELEIELKKQSSLERALKIGTQIGTQNGTQSDCC